MYSAMYLAVSIEIAEHVNAHGKFMFCIKIYIHQAIRIARVRIVKPFLVLSIITLSIVAGGVRLASNKNHWEDVIAGFALGAIIAGYLVSAALN